MAYGACFPLVGTFHFTLNIKYFFGDGVFLYSGRGGQQHTSLAMNATMGKCITTACNMVQSQFRSCRERETAQNLDRAFNHTPSLTPIGGIIGSSNPALNRLRENSIRNVAPFFREMTCGECENVSRKMNARGRNKMNSSEA